MSIVQLRFKSLVRKMSYIKSDLEYHRAEHLKRRKIFDEAVYKFITEREYVFAPEKAGKNMVDVYEKKLAVEVPELEKETKNIFKKVAKVTHPDVCKDKLQAKKFIKAREALENKDWFSMYEISADLDMDMPEPTQAHIDWLEQEIAMTEKMIKGITSTYEWIYSNEGSNKQQLLTTYCMLTCKIKDE